MKCKMIEKLFVGFLSLQLAVLPSCKSDNPSNAGDVAPEIPPIGTMTADMSLFADDGEQVLQKGADAQSNNFLQAALRVGIINTFLLIGSAVPVAATAAARGEDRARS